MYNADRHTLDELDAFLDRTFQGRAADSSALDPRLTECARRLYARDDAPFADPIFLRNLREDLMLTPTPALTGNAHAYPPSIVVPPRIVKPRLLPPTGKSAVRTLNHWRRRAWPAVELLGAAMLLMGLLVGAFVTYNNGPAALNQPAGSDIAMLGGNPARTGEMPGPGPDGQPGLVWKAGVGTLGDLSPSSTPIVANGMVYFMASGPTGAANQFFLVALDVLTGETRWETRLEGSAYAAPAVASGMVYVGTTTHHVIRGEPVGTPDPIKTDLGFVIAFDTATGVEEWRQETRGSESASPAIADGMVLIGSSDGGMYAFEEETGEQRWQSDVATYEVDPRVAEDVRLSSSTPAISGDLVFVASTTGTVYALDVRTGKERWNASVAAGELTMPVIADGFVLVNSADVSGRTGIERLSPAQELVALDVATGTIAWSVSSEAEGLLPVAVDDQRVYLVEPDRAKSTVRALDLSTGQEQWAYSVEHGILDSAVIANDTVYVGNVDGYVYALDATTGQEQWSVRLGGTVGSSMAVVDGLIYVLSFSLSSSSEASIYALGSMNGGIGTPAATPPVDGDVSGIQPCTVEPRPEPDIDRPGEGTPITEPPATPSVTPEASVVAVTDDQLYGQPAQTTPKGVPEGAPATEAQIAGITETLREMATCSRPGNEGQVASFYSDDYFRRPWVAVSVRWNGYQYLGAPNTPEVLTPDNTRILEDGRVGVLNRYSEDFALYTVFVEKDGRWLIDEIVEVTPTGDIRG
jgi:outer membrane protein assembly factor BamB